MTAVRFTSTSRTLLLVTLVAALFLATTTATQSTVNAQVDTYVNLSVEVEIGDTDPDADRVSSAWIITARNNGTAVAYGVEVDLEFAFRTSTTGTPDIKWTDRETCSENIPGVTSSTTCRHGVWSVGRLGAGDEAVVQGARGLPEGCCYPARAVIKNTFPVEEERLKSDNASVEWMEVSGTRLGGASRSFAEYWLEASVDDLVPDPGDTLTFTFKAERDSRLHHSNRTAKVRLKLNDGMGTPTARLISESDFTETEPRTLSDSVALVPHADLSRTWDWDFDLQHPIYSRTLEVSITLDNPLPAGVARSNLCLTAEMTAAGPKNSSTRSTSAKTCFRESDTLLQTGKTQLFTLFPCVGVSTYPCSSSDTVEMVVNGGEAARDGIGYKDGILRPRSVFVQIKDPEGRVATGSGRSWSSADTGLSTSIDNTRLLSADWTHWLWKIASVQLPTGGNLSITPDSTRTFDLVHTGNKAQHPPDGLTAMPAVLKSTPYLTYIKFDSLGTYIIDFTQVTTHNSGTPATDDDVDYEATGRYTFHVGPVADLGVSTSADAGSLPIGTSAFTIVAVNNGPDDAPGAQVTVAGLNADDYVSHSATAGSFDPSTGIWTIGEFREIHFQQDIYGRDGEVLTIVVNDDASNGITAEIENTLDYQVCIDSSGEDVELSAPSRTACTTEDATNTWHTTEYYDYISDNDSATITARAGTGAGHPDMPFSVRVMETSVANILIWQPVERVNGRRVSHYEVQRSDSPWTTVAEDWRGTVWVDMDLRPGRLMQYRVRAVNDWGNPGPWSFATTTGPDAPGNFTAEQLRDGEVRLTWTKPDGNGAEITGYTIQVSTNAGDSWSNAGASLNADDTSWTHRNLSVGPTRLYRIRASTAYGPGAWARSTSASISAPVLSANYDSASEIALSWSMPGGNVVPVLSWELEHSTDGSSWRRLATVRAVDGMSYTHRGRSPGATGYYRVRGSTALGHSPWSEAASATTAAGLPGNLRAEANGPNEIVLTWNKPVGGDQIWEYQLERKTEGIDWVHHASVYPEQGTSYVDSGLSAGGTWSYRLRAVSYVGSEIIYGDWTAEVSATTDSGGPDNAPTGLTATVNGETRIDLSWTAPTAGGAAVTGYRVEHSADGGETWGSIATLGNVTTYSHTGLLSGTTHHYRVAAVGGGSAGPFSTEASATTTGTETTVPGIPTNLRITSAERDRVGIAWDPPADDGGSRVTGYEYQYTGPCAADPTDICLGDVSSTSGTSATVSGLNTPGIYDVQVRAVNAVGAGEWSDRVYVNVAPEARGKVIVTPASLTVNEGGSVIYRVKLSSNPSQPIQVGLFVEDPDGVLSPALAGYQGMILLPSDYLVPEGGVWDDWAYRWDVGIPIVVEAVEDGDAADGTAVIHHAIWTAPADQIGNPEGWAPDPVYDFMDGPAIKVTVRDND